MRTRMAAKRTKNRVERPVIHLWLKRIEDRRTECDVLALYGDLEKNGGGPSPSDFCANGASSNRSRLSTDATVS